MTTFTDWDTETEELFTFMSHAWDVREAKRILRDNPRESDILDVASTAQLLSRNTENPDGSRSIRMGVTFNRDGLDDADMSVPVILVTFGDTVLPIDGWTRIARAERDGLTELPGVLLDAKETRAICA